MEYRDNEEVSSTFSGMLLLSGCSSTSNIEIKNIVTEKNYHFIGSIIQKNDYVFGIKYQEGQYLIEESANYNEAIYLNPEKNEIGVWFRNANQKYDQDDSFTCYKGGLNKDTHPQHYICESELSEVNMLITSGMNGLLAVTGIGLINVAMGTAPYQANLSKKKIFEAANNAGIPQLALAKKRKITIQNKLTQKIENEVKQLDNKMEVIKAYNRGQAHSPLELSIKNQDDTGVFKGEYTDIVLKSAKVTAESINFPTLPKIKEISESEFQLGKLEKLTEISEINAFSDETELKISEYFNLQAQQIDDMKNHLTTSFKVDCSSVSKGFFWFDVSCGDGVLKDGKIHIPATVVAKHVSFGRVYPEYSNQNKDVTVTLSGSSLQITNNTNDFVKVKSISSYVNKDVLSTDQESNVGIPPQSTRTVRIDDFLSTDQKNQLIFNQLNAYQIANNSVDFGLAIQYQLSQSATANTLFSQKNIKLKSFL